VGGLLNKLSFVAAVHQVLSMDDTSAEPSPNQTHFPAPEQNSSIRLQSSIQKSIKKIFRKKSQRKHNVSIWTAFNT